MRRARAAAATVLTAGLLTLMASAPGSAATATHRAPPHAATASYGRELGVVGSPTPDMPAPISEHPREASPTQTNPGTRAAGPAAGQTVSMQNIQLLMISLICGAIGAAITTALSLVMGAPWPAALLAGGGAFVTVAGFIILIFKFLLGLGE